MNCQYGDTQYIDLFYTINISTKIFTFVVKYALIKPVRIGYNLLF